MTNPLKALLHRRHNSADVSPPPSSPPPQSSEVRVLRAFAQPYEPASPGQQPVSGEGPVHGNGTGTIPRPVDSRPSPEDLQTQSAVLEHLHTPTPSQPGHDLDTLSGDDQSFTRRGSTDAPRQHRKLIKRKQPAALQSPPRNETEMQSGIPARRSSKRFSGPVPVADGPGPARNLAIRSKVPDQPQDGNAMSSATRQHSNIPQPDPRVSATLASRSPGSAPAQLSTAEHDTHKAAVQKQLEGVLDLRDTVDTSVSETMAPAVVHETINEEHHHIQQQVIFQEIHTHDVIHRVLPVIDVQFLPTRHFLDLDDGTSVEVPATDIPAAVRQGIDRAIHEKFKPEPAPAALSSPGRRRFTARHFAPGEGDHWEHDDEHGTRHQGTTWIHAPELEQGARVMGQTRPIRL